MLKIFKVFWTTKKIGKEFKKWLVARYLPNLRRSKDLRDRFDKRLKEIEKELKEMDNE